ncbi:MAG: glycoside hydrolase family 3 N-terminal domain-containing protein, partial [Bacteroidota bacterium]
MFKIIAIVLGGLVLLALVVVYRSIYYPMPSLKLDRQHFPQVKSEADLAPLAERLVGEMSLREKIDQLYGEQKIKAPKLGINLLYRKRFPHVFVGQNKRLHLPPWVLSDGPRGARVMARGVNAVTTFPVAMARGASWDVALERRINEVIAIEMRANQTNYAATPCINLLRHPGWGRAQETYGEDPWHLGAFGIAAVQGIEKHQVMACPKHFALNSIENSRWVINVDLDERSLREVYLPHFKRT